MYRRGREDTQHCYQRIYICICPKVETNFFLSQLCNSSCCSGRKQQHLTFATTRHS